MSILRACVFLARREKSQESPRLREGERKRSFSKNSVGKVGLKELALAEDET